MSSDSEYSDSTITSENDCYGRCEYGTFRDCIDYGEYTTNKRFIEDIKKFKKLWYATKMHKEYILVRIEPFGGLIHYKQEFKTDDGNIITQNDEDDVFRCILDDAYYDEDPDQYVHTFIHIYFIIHNEKLYKYDFKRTLEVEGDPWGYGPSMEIEPYGFKNYIVPDVDSLAGFTHINNDMKSLPNNVEYTGKIML